MLSHFFIDRPIFSVVISIAICIAGGVAMFELPIAQYPQITPVQIQVSASYPGASGTLVAQNVGAPIEQQVNGANNMIYMSSTSSSTGNYTLTVYFDIDTDPVARAGRRAEPRQSGAHTVAAVRAGAGGIGRTEDIDVPHGARVLFTRRALRHRLHRQLHERAGARHHQPDPRCEPGIDLRRAGLRDAHLVETRSYGTAQDLDGRDRERDQGTEPAVRRRSHRRGAHAVSGAADVSGNHRHDHRARAIREHDRARAKPGCGARSREGRRLCRPRRAELFAAHQLRRQTGNADRRVPAAGRKRDPGGEDHSFDAGRNVEDLPGRFRIRRCARHDVVRAGVHRRSGEDVLRSRRAGRAGGIHIPAQPAADDHSDARRAGFDSRRDGGNARIRLLDQHADAVRDDPRNRSRRGRRDRGGGEHRAEHGAVQTVCQGRRQARNGRSERAGDRRGAGIERGVHTGGIPGRNHRCVVQAVRRDDCGLNRLFRDRRVNPVAGTGGVADSGKAREKSAASSRSSTKPSSG